MMQRRFLLSAAIAAPVALAGCASQTLADYAGEKPPLDLAQYFNGRVDAHGIAREAIAQLRGDPSLWSGRPLLFYGFDDLTENQFELVAALAERTQVTVAVPYEEGNAALAARGRLIARLRERIGVAEEVRTEADPANTESPLLFHLTRSFGAPRPRRREPDGSLGILRSAGTRAEAEAIRRGCLGAWLDTFSFQARGFYERLGYAVFGALADYPPGHDRFFMQKPLVPPAG